MKVKRVINGACDTGWCKEMWFRRIEEGCKQVISARAKTQQSL